MILIGEKVNATRSSVKKAIIDHDGDVLARLIRKQSEAGADYIDLNAGVGTGSRNQEINDMNWLIDLALDVTEKPLCIDSPDPVCLERGAAHIGDRRPFLLNSAKGDDESLGAVLPVAAEHKAPVIALAMDGQGIPKDVEGRMRVVRHIAAAAEKAGIAQGDLFIDPLVIPAVTDPCQARVSCDTIRAIKTEFPSVKTVVGLSNVSHGLPRRALVNAAFLTLAVDAGLDAALADPSDALVARAIFAAELLAGRDRNCRRYSRAARKGQLG